MFLSIDSLTILIRLKGKKMKKGSLLLAAIVLIGLLFTVGCESDAQTGGLLGAGVGALAGQAIGRSTESTLIGTAVGGGAGYIIGAERDRKKTQAQTQVALQEANTFYVNVINSNGSVRPVRIVKQGNVYVGEKGEQYFKLPTEVELKTMYAF